MQHESQQGLWTYRCTDRPQSDRQSEPMLSRQCGRFLSKSIDVNRRPLTIDYMLTQLRLEVIPAECLSIPLPNGGRKSDKYSHYYSRC